MTLAAGAPAQKRTERNSVAFPEWQRSRTSTDRAYTAIVVHLHYQNLKLTLAVKVRTRFTKVALREPTSDKVIRFEPLWVSKTIFACCSHEEVR